MFFWYISFVFTGSPELNKFTTLLTSKNWNKEIEKRNSTTVYFVMFHGEHCPACQMSYPAFTEASQSAKGMVKFGNVDTSKEYNIARNFDIRGIPTFIIFHPDGNTVYYGDRSARSMINSASKYIPDLTEKVSEEWLSESTKAAILFTNKRVAPPLWSSVSCHLSNNTQNIKIGFSSDSNIQEKFQVKKIPTILFIDGSSKKNYEGKNELNEILISINKYFSEEKPQESISKPKTSQQGIQSLPSKEEFKKLCKGTNKYCVISKTDTISEQLNSISIKYRHDPFLFFTCKENCLYDFIDFGTYIIHNKRNSMIHVKNNEELITNLDRIIDGGAKFINYDKEL